MFFHVRREKNVVLEPRHFGARMKDVIMEKIKLEVRLLHIEEEETTALVSLIFGPKFLFNFPHYAGEERKTSLSLLSLSFLALFLWRENNADI